MTTVRKIVSIVGTMEIFPVRSKSNDRVEPIPSFAENGLVAAARADGFVIIPEGSEGLVKGATVTVYLQEEG
jgi:molybdopterin molybdotransferase